MDFYTGFDIHIPFVAYGISAGFCQIDWMLVVKDKGQESIWRWDAESLALL